MTNPHTINPTEAVKLNVPSVESEDLPKEWKNICVHYSEQIKMLVHETIEQNKASLAFLFYDHMMKDNSASFFLSDQLVKNKLSMTMQTWLSMIFSTPFHDTYQEVVAYQKKIGAIHARIDIPSHLVMRGARALNQGIFNLLKNVDHKLQPVAVTYVTEISHFAIEIMCHAYATNHERNSRTEEAYRLFAISQNLSSEKERQRAALFAWENQLMFDMTVQKHTTSLPKLANSEFGLWFMHKASHIFDGLEDVKKIQQHIHTIDSTIQSFSEHNEKHNPVTTLVTIREKTQSLFYLFNKLFEYESSLEIGRDALTNLLNRKYLQVIMNREINYARKHGTGLVVLGVDVDHFKKINDTYGHDAGDLALQQTATLMFNVLRGSDYIFRLGGEEFLIVLPDTELDYATKVAEKLRVRIENERITLPDQTSINLTISIGVAVHNGHPDYLPLLKAADIAVYEAKASGRNRVCCYTEGMQAA